jgi:hypothetical protein
MKDEWLLTEVESFTHSANGQSVFSTKPTMQFYLFALLVLFCTSFVPPALSACEELEWQEHYDGANDKTVWVQRKVPCKSKTKII